MRDHLQRQSVLDPQSRPRAPSPNIPNKARCSLIRRALKVEPCCLHLSKRQHRFTLQHLHLQLRAALLSGFSSTSAGLLIRRRQDQKSQHIAIRYSPGIQFFPWHRYSAACFFSDIHGLNTTNTPRIRVGAGLTHRILLWYSHCDINGTRSRRKIQCRLLLW